VARPTRRPSVGGTRTRTATALVGLPRRRSDYCDNSCAADARRVAATRLRVRAMNPAYADVQSRGHGQARIWHGLAVARAQRVYASFSSASPTALSAAAERATAAPRSAIVPRMARRPAEPAQLFAPRVRASLTYPRAS
jgi:hypothetical protein